MRCWLCISISLLARSSQTWPWYVGCVIPSLYLPGCVFPSLCLQGHIKLGHDMLVVPLHLSTCLVDTPFALGMFWVSWEGVNVSSLFWARDNILYQLRLSSKLHPLLSLTWARANILSQLCLSSKLHPLLALTCVMKVRWLMNFSLHFLSMPSLKGLPLLCCIFLPSWFPSSKISLYFYPPWNKNSFGTYLKIHILKTQ